MHDVDSTATADDLERIDALVRRRRPLQRNETLYRQGDPLQALYVVRDGAFKTVAVSREGESQVLGFHIAGELMGFDAMGSGRHQCDAEALGPAQVCEVPLDKLEEYACEVPGLRRQLFRVMGRSMDRDQAHVEMLGRRHASERVGLFLHSLAERYRILGRRPDQVDLAMNREDIGSYLGLAFETVSRALGKLQADLTLEIDEALAAKLPNGAFLSETGVAAGYLLREEGKLLSRIGLDSGALTINGQAQALPFPGMMPGATPQMQELP